MKKSDLNAAPLVAEYQLIVDESKSASSGEIDWDRLEDGLVRTAEWTDCGAAHLVALARDYGSFVLRNALALSVAANIEDGELGI